MRKRRMNRGSRGTPSALISPPTESSGFQRTSTLQFGDKSFLGGPPIVEVTGVSGTRYPSTVWNDPLLPNLTSIMYIEVPQIAVSCKAGATVNGPVDQIQQFWQQMVSDLAVKLFGEGRFVPTAALTALADFPTWVTTYWMAYGSMRFLQSLLAIDGFNANASQIAAAAIQLKLRIEAGIERLDTLPVPSGLKDLIDSTCGCFIDGWDGLMYIVNPRGGTNFAGIQDITTLAGQQALLTSAETNLNLLFSGPEAQPILQILAALFKPNPSRAKGVYSHCALYDQWKFVAQNYQDTVGPLTYTYPNISGNFLAKVPVYIRRGYETQSLPLIHLLGPQKFGIDQATNTPTVAGCLTWPKTGFYASQDIQAVHAMNSLQNAGAGVTIPGSGNVLGQNFYYTPLSMGEYLDYTVDCKNTEKYARVWLTDQAFALETIEIIDMIFLKGMSPLASYVS